MRRTLILAGALGALGGPALADCGSWDLGGAQAWSNICLSQATGDARGMRVIVRPAGAAPRVLVQVAEGAPLPPAAVAAKIEGQAVSFTTAGGERFAGRFQGQDLRLSTPRLGTVVLHRRGLAEAFPVCTGQEGRS